MSGWRLGLVVLANAGGLVACARANPAFDEERGPTDGSADDDGVASRTDGGDGKVSLSAGSGSASASGSDAGSDTKPVADDASPLDTGVGDCGFAPAIEPFLVEITVGAATMDPPCGQTYTLQGPVDSLTSDGIGLVDCGSCEPCGGEVAFVFLDGAGLGRLPPPPVPACARVEIATSPEADGCIPEIATISDAFGAGSAPEIIVTNRRHPPRLPLLAPPMPELLEAACDEPCAVDRIPGDYGLQFDNGQTLEPGTVHTISLGMAAGRPEDYAVLLRFGAIDGDCRERFGWTAVHEPN